MNVCIRDQIVGALLSLSIMMLSVFYSYSIFAADDKKPNIIFIMTDDVGYGDLGCYGGGENRGCLTPNLDRMANEGMHFTNYYGQASCTAGRAAFITGRIPLRTALSTVLAPGDLNGLHKEDPTIAEALKKLGYRTAQWGKWHLGDRPENFPTEHGFDEMYYMLPYYAGVYAYDHLPLQPDFPVHNKAFMEIWGKLNLSQWEGKAGQPPKKVKEKFGYDDLATVDDIIREDVVKYVKAHAKDNTPFFLYVCFMKVHNPNNPSPRFKGKSAGGGRYLDSLMELDDNSGQVLQAVREAGISDNTIIVWTTDNGAWIDAWPDAGYTPFRGMKGTSFEGGFRCPAIVWWPNHVKAGSVANQMMSHMDWWPTFVQLAGGTPPTHIWKDNNGKDIVFDGIENADFILGKGPSKRNSYVFINDLAFGGFRVENFKMLFTAKDTWLGPELNLAFPSFYNLWWDPGEQYDMIFNGAAPTRGDLRTSPGRFSGEDHGWLCAYMQPYMDQFFGELVKYPNRPTLPTGGSGNQWVNELNNPAGLRRLMLLLEPSSQIQN
ncbi:MAG: arylsulfatase [Parachlamydiaceae bacterium]